MALLSQAQEFRSTIFGRIMDQQQAVVPGAKVTAVEKDTGARTTTISRMDGSYTLAFLAPGTYTISVEADGFKRATKELVQIGSNERKTIDIGLEVGAVNESVTVEADAPLLDAASASVGQAVSPVQIESMPLNGGTPLIMAQLALGVVQMSRPDFVRPFDNSGASDLSIAGGEAQKNELLIDGSPNSTRNGRSAYSPPVDAVQELRVQAFESDAAYGNTGGGTVNLVSKAGTNDLHGSLYEFNQVSRLAAADWFTNRAGQKIPATRYNQYGGSAAGPVSIPRLVDGRNRLFFFFAFEGLRQPNKSAFTSTVPTAEERNGDYSKLLGMGEKYQIYDPLTGARQGSRIARQPLTGNIIPKSRLNPIALNYLQFYPASNIPGEADGRNNYLGHIGSWETYNNELGRIDYNVSDRHKMFFNFRHNQRYNLNKQRYDNVATGKHLTRKNWGFMWDDVYTFTPTTLLNTRLNWTRFTQGNTYLSDGYNIASLGFPASLASASMHAVLPIVSLSPFDTLGHEGGDLTPYDSFHIFASLSKFTGRHTIKVGTDLRLYRESEVDFGASSGTYKFGTNWTRGPLDNSPAAPIGQELSSFLLGLPTSGSFAVNGSRTNQAGYYAFFVQDDIRARSDLTVNIGLRFERETPTTERYNRVVNGFDFTSPNSVTAAAKAAYAADPIPELPVGAFNPVGGLLFAGPGNRGIYNSPGNEFSPRFGFAWTPRALGSRTVLRGGFGLFYYDLGIAGMNQTGFSQSTSFVSTLNGYLSPNATLSNPFPSGIEQPVGATLGLDTFLGKGVSFFSPDQRGSYSARWNLNIQRLITKNTVVELGYLGNHSVHLGVDRSLSFTPARFLSTSPMRDQATIDLLSANVANPFKRLLPGTSLNGSTVAREDLLQAFPEFGGVGIKNTSDGSSYFNMMQVRVERRLTAGLQVLANYQWSRMIEKRSLLNDSDALFEKRVAAEDRPHRFVISGTYDLPFGKGKAIAGSLPAVLDRIVGGWMLAGMYTWQSGQAVNWGNVIYYGGGLQWNPRGVYGSLDTSRFNTNSKQQLGANIRTFPTRFANIRDDATNTVDLSVLKNFRIHERLKLQYRCESFNTMNRPQFGSPSVNVTSSAFGKISSQGNLPRILQMALKLVW